jgi:hypothetical protein
MSIPQVDLRREKQLWEAKVDKEEITPPMSVSTASSAGEK